MINPSSLDTYYYLDHPKATLENKSFPTPLSMVNAQDQSWITFETLLRGHSAFQELQSNFLTLNTADTYLLMRGTLNLINYLLAQPPNQRIDTIFFLINQLVWHHIFFDSCGFSYKKKAKFLTSQGLP